MNLAARVWRTSGGPAAARADADLATFFGSGSDRLTDPRIIYDALSGRWFASISDIDGGAFCSPSRPAPTRPQPGRSRRSPRRAAPTSRGSASPTARSSSPPTSSTTAPRAARAPIGCELWVVNKQELLAGSTHAGFHDATVPTRTSRASRPCSRSRRPRRSMSVSVDAPSSRRRPSLRGRRHPARRGDRQEIATPSITRCSRPPLAAQPPTAAGGAAADRHERRPRARLGVGERAAVVLRRTPRASRRATRSSARARASWSSRPPRARSRPDTDLSQRGAHLFYPRSGRTRPAIS